MEIRPYHTSDDGALLQLLRKNIPRYFAPSEEADFVEYLAHHAAHYFVVTEHDRIIGAGGYNYAADGEVRISWDFIDPARQGRGIGRKLLAYRLDQIKKDPAVKEVVVRTSQLAWQFYERSGFTLEYSKKDYWAPGFDLYYMKRPIA